MNLMLIPSWTINDNLISYSKMNSVTMIDPINGLSLKVMRDQCRTVAASRSKRARHQVWIIRNKRLMTKVLLFVGHSIQITIVVTH